MSEKGVRCLFWLGVLAIQRLGEHADVGGLSGVAGCEEGDLSGEEHGASGKHDGRVIDDVVYVE